LTPISTKNYVPLLTKFVCAHSLHLVPANFVHPVGSGLHPHRYPYKLSGMLHALLSLMMVYFKKILDILQNMFTTSHEESHLPCNCDYNPHNSTELRIISQMQT
jgi:hypothetical protein